MAGLRRTLSLALLALLLVLVAGPVAAAQCRMRGACPMMNKAARTAPCHGARGSGGMSAPMDCCQPVATPAPSSALPGLETPLAALSPALPGGEIAAARLLPAAFSRAGQLHPLGLFTLHSVWRI
ncbi:MAG: hypothetical protein KBF21_02740 [Thermoanaerobaculia bacterium]|nr:hypothetical protein [Thermoanaerobaculia bacterium]MBP9823119.1 hypothetical protein [Thermoanaerobaculia bacterium]